MTLRDGLVTHPSVTQRYGHMVETGRIAHDPAQERIAAALDRLIADISDKRLARKSSALGWLFAKRNKTREPVRGLYVHGGVGRGKTMLMDLFHELVPVEHKRRAHFNDFMADVHDRIGRHRAALKAGETQETDPIPPVAAALAKEAWVLCFDEFTVTDIADAMILSRLFSALFDQGVVLVATSNVAPDDLYRDGLNRGLFLPFVGILKQHTRILELDIDTDYRMRKLNRIPVYMTPDDASAKEQMDEAWETVVDGRPVEPAALTVKGRTVPVPQASGSAARFSFSDLCEKPLGARDYLAIAGAFDTIFIDHVPTMDLRRRNEAKRFILLIDTLYDAEARLFLSAEAAPDALYTAANGTEAFEFDRTVSRLIEMQSRDWLERTGARNEEKSAPAGERTGQAG
ncbi:AFG1 family ATPase [Nitratireductor sp. L1-7-SE]|uniref:AFG1 family ATPase n=1 Tax=Nitratireductor rhodophyticola TaxID=2854036 RepID=A0ABS7R7U0_9HYPH|nr:cell division protein ZapE [Nitratireductor rhodophyticola]MBY8916056.1 AFG1 family ATPase [Nitratireductor rhodophyticola]MBY8921419.1 AFG1 family ATPase [Nitratireductor rhodophyticola]